MNAPSADKSPWTISADSIVPFRSQFWYRKHLARLDYGECATLGSVRGTAL